MTDNQLRVIIAEQPFAPLILLAIDVAAWLMSTPDADNSTDMDAALAA